MKARGGGWEGKEGSEAFLGLSSFFVFPSFTARLLFFDYCYFDWEERAKSMKTVIVNRL